VGVGTRGQGLKHNKEKYMSKLEGKVALVTGGTSGIGFSTAKQFVEEGAYVFITGRREEELAAAVKEIGRNVTGIQGDVSKLADLDRLFAQIKEEKGHLEIVFANAGTAKYAPFGKITEELFDSIFNTNVRGLQLSADSIDCPEISSPVREIRDAIDNGRSGRHISSRGEHPFLSQRAYTTG
jgi:NAD(P)-dependent dehydrogenase (short-subunit alcohol dehydrogenase family)